MWSSPDDPATWSLVVLKSHLCRLVSFAEIISCLRFFSSMERCISFGEFQQKQMSENAGEPCQGGRWCHKVMKIRENMENLNLRHFGSDGGCHKVRCREGPYMKMKQFERFFLLDFLVETKTSNMWKGLYHQLLFHSRSNVS